MLVDIHAHIFEQYYPKTLPKVIERSQKAGVKIIVNSGVSFETNKEVLTLAKTYPILKVSLGLYPPHSAIEIQNIEKDFSFVKKHITKCIAIGEVGMDRPKNRKEVDQQKSPFTDVIRLANKHNKPLVIHSRGAEKHVINTLEQEQAKKVVLHSYNGPEKYAKKAIELGYYFSVPPRVITDVTFQTINDLIPNKQILSETDSPYLAKHKEETNEPKNVKQVVDYFTKQRKKDMEKQIELNYKRLLSS
ncbi:hypothetical protein CL622_03400 [archaeon]|nr:hypothetical protein [archaeon]|tara:strand:- start:1421 stop:2161 length:741 start_codon:yes stop_codon:yes gene_type:complete